MAVNVVQTFALSGHIIEDTGNLVRVGPESAAQFLRVRDATVTYQVTTGGPTYTDTVPGLQAAVVYGSSPAMTTVDARLARYVTFITPAYGGVAPLQVAPEGAYNFLCQQGYIIPLDICYLHHWNYYQNTGGVVLPPSGGSFSGGGRVGAFDSHSFSGGGSVSGVSYTVPSPNDGVGQHASTAFGFFVKVAAAPASDMILVDFDFGSSGYLRVKLTSTLRIEVDLSTLIGSGSISDIYNGPIALHAYHWVGVNIQSPGGNQLNAIVQGPGGVGPGGRVSAPLGQNGGALTAVLSVGLPGESGFLPFPNQAGYELSKFYLTGSNSGTGGNVAPTLLTGDVVAGTTTIAYMCRDGIGAASTLLDTGSAHLNLIAGGAGITVNADGPYA